ncbi:site-2 protease family protein [soil metagenome]
MQRGAIGLGRFYGIDVAANPGVLMIGALLSWSLATVVLPGSAPDLQTFTYWGLGLVGAVLFLGSLLVHELAHSVVARRNDVEVEGITLWLFGGVSEFKSEPETPGAEFRITAAGPASSMLLGGIFVGAAFGLDAIGVPQVYTVLLGWLGFINLFLAAFNLLPGAPLDGGRLVSAALWKIRGDRVAGRIGAARAGRVVALLLMAGGVVEIYVLRGFSGLWTILIGWFLFGAARSEETYFVSQRALGNVTVGSVMRVLPPTVRTWTKIAELVETRLRPGSTQAVPVMDFDDHLAGVVTIAEVTKVPANDWPTTTAGQIATPVTTVSTSTPGERVVDLMERLPTAAMTHTAVLDPEGRFVGLIGPNELRRAIEMGKAGSWRGIGPDPAASQSVAGSTPPPPPPFVPTQNWEPPVPSHH